MTHEEAYKILERYAQGRKFSVDVSRSNYFDTPRWAAHLWLTEETDTELAGSGSQPSAEAALGVVLVEAARMLDALERAAAEPANKADESDESDESNGAD